MSSVTDIFVDHCTLGILLRMMVSVKCLVCGKNNHDLLLEHLSECFFLTPFL